MPPKIRVTKEKIVETALELVRSEGAGTLNARAVAAALGRHGVSISALSQKGAREGKEPVPVVAMTHRAKASALDAALEEIRASGATGEEPVKLRVL